MDEDRKASLELHRKEWQRAAQNLHQWLFMVITLCSAILGLTATKVLESNKTHTKIFGSVSLVVFSLTITISLGRLLGRFKNDFLGAWGRDKHVRGMHISDEERERINDKGQLEPYKGLAVTFTLFCMGILFTLLAVLPLQSSVNADKPSMGKGQNFEKSALTTSPSNVTESSGQVENTEAVVPASSLEISPVATPPSLVPKSSPSQTP